MAQKNQKVIKILRHVAEELDNVGINDCDGWHKLGRELEAILSAVPKKNKEIKALLNLVHTGLEAMGGQTANDPLALVEAVWQGLHAAEQRLSGGDVSDAQISEVQQKLAEMTDPLQHSDAKTPPAADGDSALPSIESLDDAAALLIQLEPDNHAELQNLGAALLKLTADGNNLKNCSSLISQAVDKITEIAAGRSADPAQALSEAGFLLEKAMDPLEEADGAAESDLQSTPVSSDAQLDGSSKDDPDFDHMPRDADAELIAEFIAEGSDLISSAEEALLSLETEPEDMDSVGKVFRAFHTVKGTSAFLGLDLLSEFGHHAESLLSRVRDGEIRYSGGYADLSLRALDMIKELMSRVQAALSGEPLLKPQGYDELVKLLSDPEAAGISEEADRIRGAAHRRHAGGAGQNAPGSGRRSGCCLSRSKAGCCHCQIQSGLQRRCGAGAARPETNQQQPAGS